MKAYELAYAILNLWVQNCNKSSGEMDKKNLDIPVYFDNESDGWYGVIENVRVEIINGAPAIILSSATQNE